MAQVYRCTLSLFIALIFHACGPSEEDLKRQAKAAQLQKTKTLVSSLAARHNALTEWDKHLNEQLSVFSIDVQEVMAAKQARPIVVFCRLRDVYSKDGKGYVVSEYDSSFVNVSVFFDLEAQGSLLRSVSSAEEYDSFAFVVKPTGTSVAMLKAFVEPESEEVLIDSVRTVIVRGHLLDLLKTE